METDPDSTSVALQLLLLLFFTLMNAFFAGAEMAVVSVNKNHIRMLAKEGNKKAIVIQGLFEDSTKFLSTIQVAITFAGFYSSASAASGIAPVLAQWLGDLHVPYSSAIAHNGVTLLLMFFNLVFGELVPKRVALQKAETFCMLTVMPIHYISIALSPFIRLLSLSTRGVLKLLRMSAEDQEEAVTEEEIKALLKMGYESGTFDEDEKEMIDSVFAFDDKNAREIMVPRQKVCVLEIGEPMDEMIDGILDSRHSRIPVYEEEIDNIIGILHAKDVMIALRKGEVTREDIRAMLREPYFVPEKKEASLLFREMQAKHLHMAVLVDEYGGFSGIVTIEDLVEEIMGDINEEYDEVEPDIIPVSETEFLVDGSLPIDEVNEEFGLELESEDYDTLSGYLIEKLGYIPTEKNKGSVTDCGYTFSVGKTEGNTIVRVVMKKISENIEKQ